MTYVPDYSIVGRLEDYRRMTFDNVEASFSGIVLVHESCGNFLHGDIYKNGAKVNTLINGRDGNKLHLERQIKKKVEKDAINDLPYTIEESARSSDVVIRWKADIRAKLDLRHPVYYVTDILTDAKRAYNRSVVNEFQNEVFTKNNKGCTGRYRKEKETRRDILKCNQNLMVWFIWLAYACLNVCIIQCQTSK